MKKILLAVSCLIIVIGLCACGGEGGGLFAKPTPTPMPPINPEDLISVSEASLAVGSSYSLTLSGGAPVRDGNTMTASYISDPMGAGDPIIVKIIQFNETVSKDEIWNSYDGGRVLRSSAEMVEGIGEDAYIAYPTIHVYDRGCVIEITAGSGGGNAQKELLLNLARTAVSRLEGMIAE